jgi:alkylation response protein AidB-like acyl-CoA dehydrogenase
MTAVASAEGVLTREMLTRFAKRCGDYDRENRFFQEDFDELKAAGYLTINVLKEFGGGGLSLAEVCLQQRRLAYYAPATALGINMHLYWVGVAADLWRRGDKSLQWMLEEATAGEVFAAGHSERGNDIPVMLSTSKAERVEGGFRITGRKSFGSLAPAWTRYGVHALWADAPDGPKIVHGFLPRDGGGYRIVETWDVLGMRATRSDDVILDGAFVPDKYVQRLVPAGGADEFIVAIFAWALLGFANIYYGMAQRAIDLVLPMLKGKTAVALSRSMAYHPEVQHGVAEMILALDRVAPHIDRVAEEWSACVDHGAGWPAKIVSAKYHSIETCWRILDLAMDLSGGTGMFKGNELERLFRDARCGRFHPTNSALTHEIVAKTTLGIDLGEQPRWG